MSDLIVLACLTGNLEIVTSTVTLVSNGSVDLNAAVSVAIACEFTDIALYLSKYCDREKPFISDSVNAQIDRVNQFAEKVLAVKKNMSSIVEIVNTYARDFEDEDSSLTDSDSEDSQPRPVVRTPQKRNIAKAPQGQGKGRVAKKVSKGRRLVVDSDSEADSEPDVDVLSEIKSDFDTDT